MTRIVRSSQAKQDALAIARYLVEQSQRRAVGYRFIASVEEKLKLLARHPLSGEGRPELGADVRSFPLGDYRLFYRPLADGIEILRVLHSRRDIPRIFRTGA